MKTITIEIMPGNTINAACENAVSMAKDKSCLNDLVFIEFEFNGQEIIARPTDDPQVLAKRYMDECDRRRHAEYVASPEYNKQQEEYEHKQTERRNSENALLAAGPEHMTLRDAEGWKKCCDANRDGYGGAVMTYAERWARLMEARMSKGERIADIAEECSHLADEEGITGFMYGAAVITLAHVWQHGEALRLWHNLKKK